MMDDHKYIAKTICAVVVGFMILRICESLHIYGIFAAEKTQFSTSDPVVASFSIYRDFVTVITGLLTLIIGATGAGAYLSFKEFRAEKKKIVNELKIEMEIIANRRKRLEMFLKIEEARIVKDNDNKGSLAIMKLLNDAELLYDGFPLLNVLKGEEYYLIGDGYYQAAKGEFEDALGKDNKSPRAWYGLAQAKFRLALKKTEPNAKGQLDYRRVKEFRLTKTQFVSDNVKAIADALSDMQQACALGYDEESAWFEMGRMYEALGDNANALSQYQKAFRKTGADLRIGLYYCSSWIRNNISSLEQKDMGEIVEILNRIGTLGIYNSRLAYALLWYLYSLFPDLGDAQEAFDETRPYAINELFVLSEDVRD